MKTIISILLVLLVSSTCIAAEKVQSLVGTWQSQKGALYKSDGTNFICFYIPKEYKEKLSHWQDKNRLKDIKETASGIEAIQILRVADGRTVEVPTKVVIKENQLTLTFTVASREKPVVYTFTRQPGKAI